MADLIARKEVLSKAELVFGEDGEMIECVRLRHIIDAPSVSVDDVINQRATTCRHGGHCEWVACDKCNHYEPKPETITNSTSGYLEVVLPECDDCISRQAVDELSKELVHTTRDKADFLCNFWEGLQKLPPVTPKEKTGHWVNAKVGKLFPSNDFKCSECGNILDFDGVNCGRGDANYCPNCGCHMVEPQESER